MSLQDYDRPNVAVDAVIFKSININRGKRKGAGKALMVLLVKRSQDEYVGQWSLPGGFMGVTSLLQDTIEKKLREKAGVSNVYLEQLKTFDSPARDPRNRVLSVSYLGVTNDDTIIIESPQLETKWFMVCKDRLFAEDEVLEYDSLAFDHETIIKEGLNRLKGKLDYSDLAFHLLPKQFTIKEAQMLFEVILGYRIDSFRRKLGSRVIETGNMVQRVGKPAQLFEFNPNWIKEM